MALLNTPVAVVTEPTLNQRQKTARVLLAVALVLLGLFILQGFVRALLWAGILAIATGPLYRRIQARLGADRRALPVALLFTLGVGLMFLVPLGLVLAQAGHEARGLALWLNEMRRHGVPLPEALSHLPFGQAELSAWWQDNLATPEGAQALLGRLDRAELMQHGRSLGLHLLHDLVTFTFTLVALFFLYLHGPLVTAQAVRASRRLFGTQGEVVGRQIIASVHGTVDGLVLVGLGVGFLLGVGYVLAGVPHPALLGFATAIGAMLPLGAMAALSLACLLLVVGGQMVAAAVLFAAGCAVVFVADHFVRPALIGGATRLPFLWVLLGILGGVETFGLVGLFLGPAVMAVLVLLWRDWTRETFPANTDLPPAPPAA